VGQSEGWGQGYGEIEGEDAKEGHSVGVYLCASYFGDSRESEGIGWVKGEGKLHLNKAEGRQDGAMEKGRR
jgi:hypothetical protein